MFEINDLPITFCFGEILWDILPDGPQPGGAPLNVAYHLTKLGDRTALISRVGDDERGGQLTSLLRVWGIDPVFLQRDTSQPTGIVIASPGHDHETIYDIRYPAAWDFIHYPEEGCPLLKPATCLVYGSLSSRNPVSSDTLDRLLDLEGLKVFDINLRRPFVDKGRLRHLLQKADIAKFNREELSLCCDWFDGPGDGGEDQVKFIQSKFDIPEVLLTRGSEGADYFNGDRSYTAKANAIQVMDTIGSGDAFLAAFIHSRHNNDKEEDRLVTAVLMGAFVATKKGGCPGYLIEEFEEFKKYYLSNKQL